MILGLTVANALVRQIVVAVKSSERPSRISVAQLGWKAFWLAMLLMHVAPILAVFHHLFSGLTGTDLVLGDWIRLTGLFCSAAFFFLKMVDVAWLRMAPTWRSRVTAFTIVALLHAGVIERSGVVDATSVSAQLGLVVLVAVSVDVESVRSLLARFGKLRTLACYTLLIFNLRVRAGFAFDNPFFPYESLCSHRPTAPRAPPLN